MRKGLCYILFDNIIVEILESSLLTLDCCRQADFSFCSAVSSGPEWKASDATPGQMCRQYRSQFHAMCGAEQRSPSPNSVQSSGEYYECDWSSQTAGLFRCLYKFSTRARYLFLSRFEDTLVWPRYVCKLRRTYNCFWIWLALSSSGLHFSYFQRYPFHKYQLCTFLK